MAGSSGGSSSFNLPFAVAAHPVPSDAPTLDALAVAVEEDAPGTDGGMGALMSSGAGASSDPTALPPLPRLPVGARVALALSEEERTANAAAAAAAQTTASGAAGSPPRRSSGAGASTDSDAVALGVVVGVAPPDSVSSALSRPRSTSAKRSAAAAARGGDQNTYAVALADGCVRKDIPRNRLQGA